MRHKTSLAASRATPRRPAPRNRTIYLSAAERRRWQARLLRLAGPATETELENRVLQQDLFEVIEWLPDRFVDLLFLDPPYNLTKKFNGRTFRQMSIAGYEDWLASWFPRLLRLLKPDASVYICANWQSSSAVHAVAERFLQVRNRITWEREKGRGAARNWKSASEDIWFCTISSAYTFNLEAVKLRRRVIAPYRDRRNRPKDWTETTRGKFRMTHPSNLWTDLTVPFWSMPENTAHPAQKPEKLLAKIILASSRPGDFILDPFCGSGTTAVVARKLDRRYLGIECDAEYCCLAAKRLDQATADRRIQGYAGGVFRERNSEWTAGRTERRPASQSPPVEARGRLGDSMQK